MSFLLVLLFHLSLIFINTYKCTQASAACTGRWGCYVELHTPSV